MIALSLVGGAETKDSLALANAYSSSNPSCKNSEMTSSERSLIGIFAYCEIFGEERPV